ncbi:MAG: ferredoxin-type protein NapF [Campylobacteraceae bacterium]|nr:ferredoxin-type protein NapF [Campylobacteraceae bacterium]
MKRRELFSSLVSSFNKESTQEIQLRPPYYKNESDFINKCQTCNNECASICETNIIFIQEDNTPKLDFTNSGCTYCDLCAKACPNDVLALEYKKNIDVTLSINPLECLSWNQTMCFSCKDPCLDEAIDFIALFSPKINDDCTSCGFCIKVCPTNAIKIGA